MTTLPAKVYTRTGRTSRQLRLTNQIIMDSKNEEAYTAQIQKLQQERQRIQQCISDNLIALEESEKVQALKQRPRIIETRTKKLSKDQTKSYQIDYLRSQDFSETDIGEVLVELGKKEEEQKGNLVYS